MQKFAGLARRFPEREFEIRRRYAVDEHFREICDDYEEALAALTHWKATGGADEAKAQEYGRLAAEFEAEILAALRGGWTRTGDG